MSMKHDLKEGIATHASLPVITISAVLLLLNANAVAADDLSNTDDGTGTADEMIRPLNTVLDTVPATVDPDPVVNKAPQRLVPAPTLRTEPSTAPEAGMSLRPVPNTDPGETTVPQRLAPVPTPRTERSTAPVAGISLPTVPNTGPEMTAVPQRLEPIPTSRTEPSTVPVAGINSPAGPGVGISTSVPLATEPEVITAQFAARVADARARLDVLIAAQAAAEGSATQQAIAETAAVEKEIAALKSTAGNLAWRTGRMQAYWAEMQASGFRLPKNTILYEDDQKRPFHERDANPATTIEISPRLVYASQRKSTYQEFESFTVIADGNISAGEKFLSVGLLRTPKKLRRVLGWVLRRGQIIVSDSDLVLLDGE